MQGRFEASNRSSVREEGVEDDVDARSKVRRQGREETGEGKHAEQQELSKGGRSRRALECGYRKKARGEQGVVGKSELRREQQGKNGSEKSDEDPKGELSEEEAEA